MNAILLRMIFFASWLLGTTLTYGQSSHFTLEVQARKRSFEDLRNELVDDVLIPSGIQDRRVLQAMRQTARHLFVAPQQHSLAYFDMAVPIGNGQTISPPYIVAYMTEQLKLKATDRVLEIGTGSGYQAAILSPLVKEVYTIEIVPELGKQAKQTLQELDYPNVHCRIGDGYQGWPEHAPFDRIIVTCSPESIPQPLADQLAEGGTLIIPVGSRVGQTLVRFTKTNGKLHRQELQGTFFVPMTGQAESQRTLDANLEPLTIRNGSFEQLAKDNVPAEWYYLRQSQIVQDETAPHGQQFLRLKNQTDNRIAQLLQAIQVDSFTVQEARLSLMVRSQPQPADRTFGVFIEFYDRQREPCGQTVLPIHQTEEWKSFDSQLVIPAPANFAVLGISLLGNKGTLDVDQVQLAPIR